MILSNKVTEMFLQYAQAHNEQNDTEELFDALYVQLENEYDFETADKVINTLCRCGKDEKGNDYILIESNLLKVTTI
jgi:hypothetical protein